jgi:hypothetical protein
MGFKNPTLFDDLQLIYTGDESLLLLAAKLGLKEKKVMHRCSRFHRNWVSLPRPFGGQEQVKNRGDVVTIETRPGDRVFRNDGGFVRS